MVKFTRHVTFEEFRIGHMFWAGVASHYADGHVINWVTCIVYCNDVKGVVAMKQSVLKNHDFTGRLKDSVCRCRVQDSRGQYQPDWNPRNRNAFGRPK